MLGRKFHIKTVRENLVLKQNDYLRLKSDGLYDDINVTDLQKQFDRIGEHFNEEQFVNERHRLRQLQRNRTLVCWHDSSCVSNGSHFLIMISTLYDPAIFVTNEEYQTKTGK